MSQSIDALSQVTQLQESITDGRIRQLERLGICRIAKVVQHMKDDIERVRPQLGSTSSCMQLICKSDEKHRLSILRLPSGTFPILECRNEKKTGAFKSGCILISGRDVYEPPYYILRTSIFKMDPHYAMKVDEAVRETKLLLQIEKWRDESPGEFEHVITTYFTCREEGGPLKAKFYWIQEVAAGDMLDLLNTEGFYFSAEQLLAITHQMLRALSALHKRGIIHQDIKPENILFRRSGDDIHALLADFGSAGPVEEVQEKSRHSTVGTPSYLDPDFLQEMDENKINPRTDSWALGLTLLKLALAALMPWEQGDPSGTTIVMRVRQLRQADIDALIETIPPEITQSPKGMEFVAILRALLSVSQNSRKSPHQVLHPEVRESTLPPQELSDTSSSCRLL